MDDRVYRIRELPNKSAFKQNDGSIIVKALIPEKNTEIIQRLLPYSRNGQAYVRIEIKMKNLDKIPHTYGVRLMLDTWPGLNDDITFIVPGAKGSEVLTHEVEFTPGWASMWQTYELPLGGNFNASKLCVQNIMTGHGLVPPDKIAFASWPRAYRSEWDYYVNNNISVAGWSSSALLWWNPVTTRAGDEFVAATQFGVAQQFDGPMLFSTDPDNSQGILMLRYRNASDNPIPIKHQVSCSDGQILLPENEQLDAVVKPKELFMKAVPVAIIGSGRANVRVSLTAKGETKHWDFSMHGSPPSNSLHSLPVAEAGRSLPVRYYLAGPARRLMARIVTRDGIELAKTGLRCEPWLDGILYVGTLRIPNSADGRIVLEVLE